MNFPTVKSNEYREVDVNLSDNDIISQMRSNGLVSTPLSISYDGAIHRFASDPSKVGDKAGWYVAEIVSGVKIVSYGDWRTGANGVIKGGRYSNLTDHERLELDYRIEQMRAEEEKKRKEYQISKAKEAEKVWDKARDASEDFGYIGRKGLLSAHGARLSDDGRLMVPMFNAEGDLQSIQYISSDGEKRFYPGASTKNGHWFLGDMSCHRVFLCEGFATACSIHEASGVTTFMAYSADNLPGVAKMLVDRGHEVTIIADNDKSSKGQDCAEKAKAVTGCSVMVIPNRGDPSVTDANDYQQRFGNLSDILPKLNLESKMLLADDILSEVINIKWLVKGWIPQNSIGMVFGPSASGKTNVVMDLLLSVSSGQSDWHGFKIREAANVVYLCGEGLSGVKMRIKAWSAYHNVDKLGRFAVYPLPLDLDTEGGIQEIREQIGSLPWNPDILVVDTVNRYMSGDENSAQDTRTFLNAVDRLRNEYHCTGLYIHHTGNDENAQKRARGSSAWKGALDFEFSVIHDDNLGVRRITQTKMKDTELHEPVYGIIQGVDIPGLFDEDGEQMTGAVFDFCDAPASEVDKALGEAVNDMLMVLSECEYRTIKREVWKEWLVAHGKVQNARNATKLLSDERPNRPVGRLIQAGVLTKVDDDTWKVEDTPLTHVQLGFMGRLF